MQYDLFVKLQVDESNYDFLKKNIDINTYIIYIYI